VDLSAVHAEFAGRPWRAIPKADLAPALAVPSMLSEEETALYVWLGERASGIGATIDLGAFAGGSAARLLTGLARSAGPYHLHAYDRFTAKRETRERHLYAHGVPESDDNDILPLARRHLAPWADHVTLHRGDIADVTWTGDPVEILAVDAGKTPALTDRIAAQFYPALVPHRSVLIHQDFLHAVQPWLAVQMVRLADHFVPLCKVSSDCVVFLCVAPVTPAALTAARTEGLSDAALIEGLRAAGDHFAASLPRDRIRDMVKKVRSNPGVRISWQMR
jgi:hypothetical protein